MNYSRAALILDGMIENKSIEKSAKWDILELMRLHGDSERSHIFRALDQMREDTIVLPGVRNDE
jgi:hypothetical protein